MTSDIPPPLLDRPLPRIMKETPTLTFSLPINLLHPPFRFTLNHYKPQTFTHFHIENYLFYNLFEILN